mmetsp:Transcript_10579/g.30559  ORF Transcript_10579/g.30559 Transcript_10579/m.30559 type:complete len:320 (-) Transcript_10579:263-1222(-)
MCVGGGRRKVFLRLPYPPGSEGAGCVSHDRQEGLQPDEEVKLAGVVEEVVRARADATRMKRQHAPCEPLPSGIPSHIGVLPYQPHGDQPLHQRRHVDGPRRQRQGVPRLRVRIRKHRQGAQQHSHTRNHRALQPPPSALAVHPPKHSRGRHLSPVALLPTHCRRHSLLHLLLLPHLVNNGLAHADNDEQVGDGEERLSAPVEVVDVGELLVVPDLGKDASGNGHAHKHQQELEAEVGQPRHPRLGAREEPQEGQVREERGGEQLTRNVLGADRPGVDIQILLQVRHRRCLQTRQPPAGAAAAPAAAPAATAGAVGVSRW